MKPDQPLKTSEYIELIRQKMVQKYLKKISTYAIAKELDIAEASLSRYLNHRGAMDDKTAVKVARYLNIPEIEVIAAANAERSPDKESKEFWKGFFKSVAATAVLGVAISSTPVPMDNQQSLLPEIARFRRITGFKRSSFYKRLIYITFKVKQSFYCTWCWPYCIL